MEITGATVKVLDDDSIGEIISTYSDSEGIYGIDVELESGQVLEICPDDVEIIKDADGKVFRCQGDSMRLVWIWNYGAYILTHDTKPGGPRGCNHIRPQELHY